MRFPTTRTLIIGVLALSSLVPLGAGGRIQEADSAQDAGLPGLPAHIHAGSCETFDPTPRFPLSDVSIRSTGDDPVDSDATMPAGMSVTTIDARLTDILAGQYVVDAHEGAQNADHSIACGELGGQSGSNELAIGLKEQDHSGYAGIAWLRAEGDTTKVTVLLAEGLAGNTESTQAQATFFVETITCPSCQLRVEGSIKQAPGIVDIAWQGKVVTVTYDPSQVTPDEIRAAIENGGDTADEVTETGEE